MSKVIKASQYTTRKEMRLIEYKWLIPHVLHDGEDKAQTADEAENDAPGLLDVAKEEIARLRQQAHAEIERMKEEAVREIEELRRRELESLERLKRQQLDEAFQKGYREGYEQGFNQGLHDAAQEYESRIERAAHLIEQAEKEWKRRVSEAESFLLNLAVDIAEKIVYREINRDEQAIVDMVKQTLKMASDLKEITICVHPDDYELVIGRSEELQMLVANQANLLIVPDHTILNGGCVIRSSLGSLDARIDTQLSEIRQALLDAVQGSEPLELGMA